MNINSINADPSAAIRYPSRGVAELAIPPGSTCPGMFSAVFSGTRRPFGLDYFNQSFPVHNSR